MRSLFGLCLLLFSYSAWAATATVEIYHLPLNEATQLIQTQLSPSGSTAVLTSRHIIVIQDDNQHIEQARALLKKLDVPTAQYMLFMDVMQIEHKRGQSFQAAAVLPGGWIKLQANQSTWKTTNHQSFQLRMTSNKQGMIELGTIQPYREHIRQWLAGYGVIERNSVQLVSLTSGLIARIQHANKNSVQIAIRPWMRRLDAANHMQGQTELLLDLGNTQNPKQAPSNLANLRLNANRTIQTKETDQPPIQIVNASTTLSIPLNQSVTILASNQEAALFSKALFAQYIGTKDTSLLIQIRIEKR